MECELRFHDDSSLQNQNRETSGMNLYAFLGEPTCCFEFGAYSLRVTRMPFTHCMYAKCCLVFDNNARRLKVIPLPGQKYTRHSFRFAQSTYAYTEPSVAFVAVDLLFSSPLAHISMHNMLFGADRAQRAASQQLVHRKSW